MLGSIELFEVNLYTVHIPRTSKKLYQSYALCLMSGVKAMVGVRVCHQVGYRQNPWGMVM